MERRGEGRKVAPSPKGNPKRVCSGSLGSNLRSVITGMELERLDERRQAQEDIRRITSLEVLDLEQEGPVEGGGGPTQSDRRRFERLLREMDREFERLLSG